MKTQLIAAMVLLALTNVQAKEKPVADTLEARVAAFGPRPEYSEYRDSYLEVETYLRRNMDDPKSLEMAGCLTKMYVLPDGWQVNCTFRGKTKFGGLIKQSSWFTIRQSKVVRMEPERDYPR